MIGDERRKSAVARRMQKQDSAPAIELLIEGQKRGVGERASENVRCQCHADHAHAEGAVELLERLVDMWHRKGSKRFETLRPSRNGIGVEIVRLPRNFESVCLV